MSIETDSTERDTEEIQAAASTDGGSEAGANTDPQGPPGGDGPGEEEATVEAVVFDPLEEAQQKAASLKDQLMRTAADFDNFRKRTRREVEEAGRAGREAMLKDLLPVFDNLERATAVADTATDVTSFANGIEMVMRQFRDTLGRLGIERVPGVGEPFDPMVHEAIQHLETDDYPSGTVAAEVQGGYRFKDRLIRPAMVVVAKGRAGGGNGADDEGQVPN